MPLRGDREGFQAERLLPALLYVFFFLLSVVKMGKRKKKSTVTRLIVCFPRHKHTGGSTFEGSALPNRQTDDHRLPGRLVPETC